MSEVTYFILYILQHNKGRHQPFWSDLLNPLFCLSLIFLSGDAPFSPCAGATLAGAGRGSHPLLLLPPIPPSIRVFSNESTLRMRWPKYWSFSLSISPSNEYSGLISYRIDWLDLLAVQGTLKSILQHHTSKASILRRSASSQSNSHIHTLPQQKP